MYVYMRELQGLLCEGGGRQDPQAQKGERRAMARPDAKYEADWPPAAGLAPFGRIEPHCHFNFERPKARSNSLSLCEKADLMPRD